MVGGIPHSFKNRQCFKLRKFVIHNLWWGGREAMRSPAESPSS